MEGNITFADFRWVGLVKINLQEEDMGRHGAANNKAQFQTAGRKVARGIRRPVPVGHQWCVG